MPQLPLPTVLPIPPQPEIQATPLPRLLATALASGLLTKVGDDSPLTVAGASFPVARVAFGRSLLVTGRFQAVAGAVDIGLRFNNDSANNYAFLNIFSAGAGVVDGASTIANFALVAQATAGSSASFFAFVGGHRVPGLTNVPVIGGGSSAVINLLRASYWNQSGPVDTVQVVASANMAVNSYAAVYVLG